MNYCPDCAQPVIVTIPEKDNRPRHTCKSCASVHYENPKMVVGTIPLWNDKILLCKRNIEPRKGYWTLPAGYLENNETVEEGARRETEEETGAILTNLQPYRLFDIVHVSQMYCMFLAELTAPNFHATEESQDVRLFDEADIPWDEIAFPVINTLLHHFFVDRKRGSFTFLIDQITERMHTNC